VLALQSYWIRSLAKLKPDIATSFTFLIGIIGYTGNRQLRVLHINLISHLPLPMLDVNIISKRAIAYIPRQRRAARDG
jgi:hypothetical protein